MNLSEYAVKNYQFTLVIFLMIVALGVTTIMNMPRSEDPELNAPQFPIVAVYPGASPEDMEELVADPLEKKIYELEDIKTIKTTISDGVATLFVEFKYESDVNEKYQELVREVNAMKTDLPDNLALLEVRKVTPTDVNVIQIAMVSETASMEELRRQSERLEEQLEKIKSLKKVTVHGIPNKIVRISLNLEKMAAMHIPVDAVLANLQTEMVNVPGGSVEAGTKIFNIKTSGNFNHVNELSQTVVYSQNKKNIKLQDIAQVYQDEEDINYIIRSNGYRSVLITAAQKAGFNISQTQSQYKSVIEKFDQVLPEEIDLVFHFDQAENVNHRLSGLGKDFLIAILLVLFTLLPLGQRAAIIVMISIPLSLSIGIVLLNYLGYGLNQLSIVGLVVALGLLVDDSIVVVENIERWLRMGYSKYEAAIKATKQITLAVIGCTATLIIAFLPLVFMPEASGEFIRGLPMGVILSVLASLFVSLTIIPFLSSKILNEHHGHPEGNMFMRALKKLIQGSYGKLLDQALAKPWLALTIASLIFLGSLFLFPVIGFSLFPASEKPQFMIEITTPYQSNLKYTDHITRKIEEDLKKVEELKYYTANIGKGNPRIYYNVIPGENKSDYAQLFVQLEENTSADEKLKIIDMLRSKWSTFPDAKVEVKNFEQGPPIEAPVEIRLFGENRDSLQALAVKVESELKNIPGAIYVNNPIAHQKTDLKLDINTEKAQMLGIQTLSIDRSIRMAVAGLEIGKFTDDSGDELDVIVSNSTQENATTLRNLEKIHIQNNKGAAVPLSQLATLNFESSPLNISHLDKVRTVSITAFVQQGFLADEVINKSIQMMNDIKLPDGFSYEMGGEVESRNESFGGFANIIIITIFLFIAVLVLEFGTFKSTLIVLSVIPLGIVGAVLALLITGNSLSFVAIIGLIALAGIEVKNTILLVDFTNQLRSQGMELNSAIKEAGEVRFLPIVLTSLTAIGGLMPIAVSTNPLISPLAIVLIGGLISSTLLSRVVTPVIYKLIPPRVLMNNEKSEKE